MVMSVSEVASLTGVTPRRVLQWIHSGAIRALSVGGVYLIEESELARPRAISRPMSERMAWA
ncbi:MAG: helix-turn-helix domain-containing protein, partial [Propionibacteriaceae bacterium]|nr:helix-turn-helix domain-containing protein [Propionibacteriaceae bacterium]